MEMVASNEHRNGATFGTAAGNGCKSYESLQFGDGQSLGPTGRAVKLHPAVGLRLSQRLFVLLAKNGFMPVGHVASGPSPQPLCAQNIKVILEQWTVLRTTAG
jgi:hypothetical protein